MREVAGRAGNFIDIESWGGGNCSGEEVGRGEGFGESEEAGSLILEALVDGGVGEVPLVVEEAADLGEEDAAIEEDGVAVGEDHLELFDRADGAAGTGGEADEGGGARFKGIGKREEVDEQLEGSGKTAIVFRSNDDEATGFKDRLDELVGEGSGFGGVGLGREGLEGHLGEVEQVGRGACLPEVLLNTESDFAGIAARAIGSGNNG